MANRNWVGLFVTWAPGVDAGSATGRPRHKGRPLNGLELCGVLRHRRRQGRAPRRRTDRRRKEDLRQGPAERRNEAAGGVRPPGQPRIGAGGRRPTQYDRRPAGHRGPRRRPRGRLPARAGDAPHRRPLPRAGENRRPRRVHHCRYRPHHAAHPSGSPGSVSAVFSAALRPRPGVPTTAQPHRVAGSGGSSRSSDRARASSRSPPGWAIQNSCAM